MCLCMLVCICVRIGRACETSCPPAMFLSSLFANLVSSHAIAVVPEVSDGFSLQRSSESQNEPHVADERGDRRHVTAGGPKLVGHSWPSLAMVGRWHPAHSGGFAALKVRPS